MKKIIRISLLTLSLVLYKTTEANVISSFGDKDSFGLVIKNTKKASDLNVLSENIFALRDFATSSEGNILIITPSPIYISAYRLDRTKDKFYALINPKQKSITISGKVKDDKGEILVGVNIIEKGTKNGVVSDIDGSFSIKIKKGSTLVFSYVGYKAVEKVFNASVNSVSIAMKTDTANIKEVLISVGFGKQKKASVVSSIETINPKDLKIPSSNLTNSLLGRLSGITGFQRSGEPGIGTNDTKFFIRGISSFGRGDANNPLILIDGVELTIRDLARLQPDDIESFSIMKDATATAIYGARGANGVIFVTTKRGKEGPLKVSFRFETSISQPTKEVSFTDPITFMELHNEAVRTRDLNSPLPYSFSRIERTRSGENPILYPTVDWRGELFKKQAINRRVNINLSGGGEKADYFVAMAMSNDNGLLRVPKVANYNNNVDYSQYQLRSNIGMNLTKTTKLITRFIASYDDYTGPVKSGNSIYESSIRSNPVIFRPYYEKDKQHIATKHILFGNYEAGGYSNPYADLVSGYREQKATKIIAQLSLDQKLYFLTKGLDMLLKINVNTSSGNAFVRQYKPFYYSASRNIDTQKIELRSLNPNEGTEFLNYKETGKEVTNSVYFESRLSYSKKILENYEVGGLLVYTLNSRTASNPGNLQASLPFRNLGVSGRFTLGAFDKYFAEFSFGYNGSERFHKSHRFGFFPSFGLGWIISREDFFKKSLGKVITNLKFRLNYGIIGNDQIGPSSDRFFYLSRVNLLDRDRGYTTGTDFDKEVTGVSIKRYANEDITWELSKKYNFGIDLSLFGDLSVTTDLYKETRSNILIDRIIPSNAGLEATVRDNKGIASVWGIDSRLTYNKSFGNWWIQGMANFTYSNNKIVKTEEPNYSSTPYLSKVGHPIRQQWGLVAERLFIDKADIANSPEQTFGEYLPGDIKYRDINGDGKISDLDKVPIGNPTTPEIVYGFGFSAGYKGFDLSCFFQGSANESFWINAAATAPFVGGQTYTTQMLTLWQNSYWSESNRDIYARWPRLSERAVKNNTRVSTWFMQDASYLRLKSMEFGYSLPGKLLNKFKIKTLRLYFSGTNLLTFSKFSFWDPGMAGNGMGYPLQKVFNIGVRIAL